MPPVEFDEEQRSYGIKTDHKSVMESFLEKLGVPEKYITYFLIGVAIVLIVITIFIFISSSKRPKPIVPSIDGTFN